MTLDALLMAGAKFLEVAHVAHRLGIGDQTVRRLIRNRQLRATRIGGCWRIDPDDLDAFIERNSTMEPTERRELSTPALMPLAVAP